MKKILLLLFIVISLFLTSCNTNKFDPNKNLDLDNVYFDDFLNGIDRNYWKVGNKQWGINNGGVIYQNVNYTEDGIVVLQCNGDYYDGDLVGINKPNGKRTGALIKTQKALGPGRYEVKLKVLPRFGSTTAIWTYYFKDGLNHEIDIETNVHNDFKVFMTTNWISLTQKSSVPTKTNTVLNDNEWHVFRFDWHTNPKRVDYYLDDVLISTQKSYVPDHAGEFNIGNWFPDSWAGTPDFETDYTFVDWFRYTPFKNNDYVKTPDAGPDPVDFYPKKPIKMPIGNLISNPGFENDPSAWKFAHTSNVEIKSNLGINNSKTLYIPASQDAHQVITGLDESFELVLSLNTKFKDTSKGIVLIEFYPDESTKISQKVIKLDKNDPNFFENKFFKKVEKFTLPQKTKRVELYLICEEGEMYFDDLFFNLTSKYEMYNKNLNNDNKQISDFKLGIDKDNWVVANRKWSVNNGGVLYQNVHHVKDRYVAFQANGDNYQGDLIGIDYQGGKRTGGAIYSKKAYGPGSFEVEAKIMPRIGAATAFWTYFNDGTTNSEIDIELGINNKYRYAMFTNWLTLNENEHTTIKKDLKKYLNDGNWHKFRFDWHTEPVPKVEYYIDDILYHVEKTNVPKLAAHFWIGVWFPNEWAGMPNFEKDYLYVRKFSYEKFEKQKYIQNNHVNSCPEYFYPKTKNDLKKPNLISNFKFQNNKFFELKNDAKISNNILNINNNGIAIQKIDRVLSEKTFYLNIFAKAKHLKVTIKCYDENQNYLSKFDMNFNNVKDYRNLENTFNVFDKTDFIIIEISGKNLFCKEIFLNSIRRI